MVGKRTIAAAIPGFVASIVKLAAAVFDFEVPDDVLNAVMTISAFLAAMFHKAGQNRLEKKIDNGGK